MKKKMLIIWIVVLIVSSSFFVVSQVRSTIGDAQREADEDIQNLTIARDNLLQHINITTRDEKGEITKDVIIGIDNVSRYHVDYVLPNNICREGSCRIKVTEDMNSTDIQSTIEYFAGIKIQARLEAEKELEDENRRRARI